MLKVPVQLKDFLAPYPLAITVVRLLIPNKPEILTYANDLFMFPRYANLLLYYVDHVVATGQNRLEIILSKKPYYGKRPSTIEVLRILDHDTERAQVRIQEGNKHHTEICGYHVPKTYIKNNANRYSKILTRKVKHLRLAWHTDTEWYYTIELEKGD